MSNVFQPFSLNGKVTLVTGASRGIGYRVALVLAKAGADLVLASRNVEALEKAAEEVQGIGARGLVVACDVSVKAFADL